MDNIFKEVFSVTRNDKETLLNQKGRVLWFTGLSGSGKSTLAKKLECDLTKKGKLVIVLDGDNLRFGLCNDLGFSSSDRRENLRRVREVAKLLVNNGIIVLVSYISPFANEREIARNIFKDDFIEIFVNTPIEVCEERDVKGLYKKAREGELKEFTGISAVFEEPLNPEIEINTANVSIEKAINKITSYVWGE
ncbi:MAG: adenylyl-sulfate kinase [Clostridium sp.]